ncbi:MAG TPA: nucleotidyltransferase family protein [Candidatus Atribacteria bacterium]|nr:nucleotidyltransferase family protein [Candidatus Atribacteria bacterium]HQE25686.1 nucleotidyltransferase family protein [Candidatus Atribacteria bacterium]
MDIEEIKKKIIPVLQRYQVRKASIFGSIVRGEDTPESDIDILVELNDNLSLLDFVSLKLELEEALQKRVDLVEKKTLKETIKDEILSQEVQVW